MQKEANNSKMDRYAAKVLDRQIRLFGKDLQIKLLNSSICMIGLSPSNTEIAKNLVLKALNLDIFDSRIIDQETINNNFLLSDIDLGKQRGIAAIGIFKEMNPITKLNAFESINIDDPELPERLRKYDIWIVETSTVEEIRKWDKKAHSLNKPLFCPISCGFQAFSFCSLGQQHEIMVKKKDFKGAQTFKKVLDNINKCTINSWDLQSTIDMDNFSAYRDINTTFFAIVFKDKVERNEPFGDREIEEALKRFYNVVDYSVFVQQVKETIANWGLDFCPVNSVLGSIISQEVVSYYEGTLEYCNSATKVPALNWLIFDSVNGIAEVTTLQTLSFN